MIRLLSSLFIPNSENVSDPRVRSAYGILCGIVGIFLNLLLFAGKLTAGLLTGSIAIVADAFNNLSDAGSSVITLLGFKLAGQKPDPEHPFGHGRIEYISGLIVSMMIVLMGFELGKSSIEKLIHPEETRSGWIAVAILAVSILVKLYMFLYNRSVGKKIDSAAMRATAADSLSDSAATAAVLLATILSPLVRPFPIDAVGGLLVALFILRAGIMAAIDTVSPLLGQPPEPEFVSLIEKTVRAHEEVVGIHDLIVHDYGPGRQMISLHAEISDKSDILQAHDLIDNIEQELRSVLGCEAVIHMDPIASDDETVNELRSFLEEQVRSLDPSVTIHDFRMVRGETHTNLIFDVVVPFGFRMSDEEVRQEISRIIKSVDRKYFAVIRIDKSYVK